MPKVQINISREVFLPKYRYLIDSDADVVALWGGRDSGKTYFAAQKLVKACLELPYFKCILVRRVQDTIKESQFEAIKGVVNDWGLQEFFDFISHPLEIRCKNGNRFIARGCDKIEKIKSVKDPTHVWFEEMDQITSDDHAVISTTIRSSETKTQEVWSFNPESEGRPEESWLYKQVGEKYRDWSDERIVDVDGKDVIVKYEFNHSTYRDNKYCPPDRVAKYQEVVKGDRYRHDVWINGWWGKREVKRPFAYNFTREKHVSTGAIYREGLPIRISVDFNYDPFTANIAHQWTDKDGQHLHVFAEVAVLGSVEELVKRIKSIVPNLYNAELTGDAMGKNRRIKIKDSDNNNLFTELRDQLGLHEKQLRLPKNPFHKESREDFNFMLAHYPDYKVHPSCNQTIRDLEIVEIDEHGSIKKSNRDKESERADFLDNQRYLQNTFLHDWLKAHKATYIRKK